jgi:hypothetical protein
MFDSCIFLVVLGVMGGGFMGMLIMCLFISSRNEEKNKSDWESIKKAQRERNQGGRLNKDAHKYSSKTKDGKES